MSAFVAYFMKNQRKS